MHLSVCWFVYLPVCLSVCLWAYLSLLGWLVRPHLLHFHPFLLCLASFLSPFSLSVCLSLSDPIPSLSPSSLPVCLCVSVLVRWWCGFGFVDVVLWIWLFVLISS